MIQRPQMHRQLKVHFSLLVTLIMLLPCRSLLCQTVKQEGPAIPVGMIRVPAGTLQPRIPALGITNAIKVATFALDRYPVTTADYLAFVQQNPKWQRSNVKRLFADENYLRHWEADLLPGKEAPLNQPVINISWFAAKAFADWKGKRLPTLVEWEYAAAFGFTDTDGTKDKEFQSAIRQWYSSPTPARLPDIGQNRASCIGLYDMHGLIWEWVSDFNSAMVTGDARNDSGLERQLFCGSGAIGSLADTDYPTFLRYGFRSSLKASYCLHNLGFRCAQSL